MRIGVDVGGTKIEAVLYTDGLDEVARLRRATPRFYPEFTAAIHELVTGLRERGRGFAAAHAASLTDAMSRVGICLPGSEDPVTRAIGNSNLIYLNGRDVRDDLTDAIGIPIEVNNDADCMLVSELHGGAAQAAGIAFGVILGTGVGGAVAVEGKLLKGPSGLVGEWGHAQMPSRWCFAALEHGKDDGKDEVTLKGPSARNARKCWCSQVDCIETYLCGAGLRALFEELSGLRREPEQIAALVREAVVQGPEGDSLRVMAELCLQRYFDGLACALAQVVQLLDPSVIVLAGGLSSLPGLRDATQQGLSKWTSRGPVRGRVLLARFGVASGTRGAALLA